jgi:hypothetical protein
MLRKRFISPLLIGVTLSSLPALANAGKKPMCHTFEGTFTIAVDNHCDVTKLSGRRYWYPDVQFLSEVGVPDTCFTGSVTGTLGGLPMEGKTYSGQTVNNFPTLDQKQLFTAITVLDAKTIHGHRLGKIIFKDTGIVDLTNFLANEQLIATAGTNYFQNITGSIAATGNEFAGANLSGQLCISSKR